VWFSLNSSLAPTQIREREFFIDNLLARNHFIIVMIRWTGLAPWEFEFPFPGSLTSTFLADQIKPHGHGAAVSHHVARKQRPLVTPDPGNLQPSLFFVITPNPKPQTATPKPQTQNPQPSTLNPQPSTVNPQPSWLENKGHWSHPTLPTFNLVSSSLLLSSLELSDAQSL